MNAVRREEANEDPYRQRAILPDPTDLHYDEIALAFTAELDQDLQDKEILQPKQCRVINLVHE